ncbi:hypothetical protein KKG41_02375 [Patescibacteria group bacterium]|nr:hypothetical protein [Patescibacteria group bacterium]
MRKRFEDTVNQYGTDFKGMMGSDSSEPDYLVHLADLSMHISRAAKREGTSAEDQKRIASIQRGKLEIMQQLKSDLSAIDDPESDVEQEKGSRIVRADEFGYQVETEDGQTEEITLGEIMTDGDWGVAYHMDPETVPRNVRKRFLVEEAKRQLADLYDDQMLIQGIGSDQIHDFKRQTYRRIQKDKEAGETHAGLIAEQMVRNLLAKMTIDNDVDFEIIGTDVFQDVERKVDFIVHLKTHRRGVSVEESEQPDTVGIQFTTSTAPYRLAKKQKQIDRAIERRKDEDDVDDILLVSIPMKEIWEQYRAWKQTKSAGGPDKLWDDETKEKIFRGVMDGVLDPERIEEHLSAMRSDRSEPLAA